jgi:ketosteroid isomerase-like protein
MGTEASILDALHGLASAFNAHDIDGVMRFFAPDCSLDMPRGTEPHGTRFHGFELVKKGACGAVRNDAGRAVQ